MLDGQEASLLGAVADDVRSAFSALSADSALTAGAIARQLDWTADRAHAAISTLTAMRLARPSGDGFLRLPLA
jgi:hypothetical protein